jgi:hypothetical protein
MDLAGNRESYTDVQLLDINICKDLGFQPSQVKTLFDLQGLKLLRYSD